jgi:predicted aspartyl protease
MLVVYGPTLSVDIGFDPAFVPGIPVMISIPGMAGIDALVDTGATECCIDSLLATQLNLPVIDKRQVHRALMGRSFLRSFAMTYDGRTGNVEISSD